jgi:hypothetical protein
VVAAQPGVVVLVRFPFSDLSSTKHPKPRVERRERAAVWDEVTPSVGSILPRSVRTLDGREPLLLSRRHLSRFRGRGVVDNAVLCLKAGASLTTSTCQRGCG